MRPFAAVVSLLAAAALLHADEGMWLFNEFPKDRVEKKYKFDVSNHFLDHLGQGSVRFNNGGSGSFISPHGLLFTNHHVGADCIQKLSSSRHDYMTDGFYAASAAEEQACPDLEVNILLKIDDVTSRITTGAASMPAAEAERTRRAHIAQTEKECTTESGNRCEVVNLFSGGRYHLYQYKKYTDVRLVFAPEYSIASFGGDPDNFTYPRYDLDFTLFRAYENGKPVSSPAYFPWSAKGASDKDLVFVPGNPGSTGRLATYAELEFDRDALYPLVLEHVKSVVDTLLAYSGKSTEAARQATQEIESQQNSFKAFSGFERGLLDPKLMALKLREETTLRKRVDADPKMRAEYGPTWDQVAGAYREWRALLLPYYLLESRSSTRGSDLLHLARILARYAEETKKPNTERLREFRDSALPVLDQEINSSAPIYKDLETAVLANHLAFLQKKLGAGDPTVQSLLDGRTPAEAAAHYVGTSKLEDLALRKQLAASPEAVRESQDGMIRMALLLDKAGRKLRKQYEDKVEAVLSAAQSKIARARFAANPHEYPDATFTLRLAYGQVVGYRNQKKQWVPYATRTAGLYQRATGQDPYKLPESWLKAKRVLNPKTPFNFVSTADTHGGNSGSPTLNTRGEIVGILFDGNIEGLPNRFIYTEEQARSVHVASQIILEALRSVYHADRVVKELGQQ